MRFIGYRVDGHDAIGVVEGDAVRRLADIEEFYADVAGATGRGAAGPFMPLGEVEQVPPVPRTAKVLCMGMNYQTHVDEIHDPARQRPAAPNIFARWYASLACDGATTRIPSGESGLDWECELAVVIGRHLVDTSADNAMDGVLGYTAFNDITSRTYQRRTPQWALGKNVDASGAIGPVVVTADELGDPYGLGIATRVNGETMQSSTTDHMIFDIAYAIEYITACTSLRPGDVIATGTPEGVGAGRTPPVYLGPGDIVEVEIERIGALTSHIA